MKTIIEHQVFGRMEYDTARRKLTVEKGDIADRIAWLLKPENEHLLGGGYIPDLLA